MKRLITAMILGSVLMLAACGNAAQDTGSAVKSTQEQIKTESSSASGEQKPEEQQAESEASSASEAERIEEQETEEDFVPLDPFKKEATIEETVLFDQQDVRITAKTLTYGNYSAELELLLENNSDKDLSFIAQSMGYSCNAINDTMLPDGYINEDVPAGESVTGTMKFGYENMLLYGIYEIGTIQTGFDISDDDYNDIYTGPVEVKTSAADTVGSSTDLFRKTMQSKAVQYTYDLTLDYYSEEEVYSSAGVSIISEILMKNSSGGRILMLEVKNDTENTANIMLKDIKVNDELIYEGRWTGESITAGKRAVADIALDRILDEEEWAELGIEDIESIGFTVEVMNDDRVVMAEPKEVIVRTK